MTYQDFLQKLSETPREWEIWPGGAIRCGCDCPILFVAQAITGHKFLSMAGAMDAIEVPHESPDAFGNRVWQAADWIDGPQDVRADLLRACGLSA